LDEYYVKHGKPIGPLHGLPVSLKDQFHVKGVETTMGYVGVSIPFDTIYFQPYGESPNSLLDSQLT
jgi:hypothetical protein